MGLYCRRFLDSVSIDWAVLWFRGAKICQFSAIDLLVDDASPLAQMWP